jgi:DNA-binding response OmpR family regulator
MRKYLVLFVQPEMARQFDFMKLYESGLITDWVRDTKAAQSQLTSFVDVVALDIDRDPEDALAFCREAKRQRGDRVVVFLATDGLTIPANDCVDLVLPRHVSQEQFVREVLAALDQHRRRAAS